MLETLRTSPEDLVERPVVDIPFRHLDRTLSKCQASAKAGNKRPSPCETLVSIMPLHRVAFMPKIQLLKRGAE